MKVKILLVLIILFLAVLPSGKADSAQSNDNFVRNSFLDMANKLFENFTSNGPVNMIFKCAECPRDFFINLLSIVLKQKGTNLYIDSKESGLDRLEVHLYSSDFYYKKNGGSLFSKGQLERKYSISTYAVLLNSSGRVLWQNENEDKYTEKINWEIARSWQKHSRGIFNAPIPPTKRNRLWEPIVISSLLGGLIYLFFASR